MIDFSGVDIVLEKRLEADVFKEALSKILSLPVHRISVIDDIDRYPERGTADVVCVISPVAGQFAAVLSIQNGPIRLPLETPLEVTQQLASALKLKCLTPKEGVDPYLMWLVLPDSTPAAVALDPKALDEERYIVRPVPW